VASKVLTPHAEYLALARAEDARHRAYGELLGGADEPSFLAAIREATNGGLALVDDELKAKLEAQTGRRLEHRKSGPASSSEQPTLETVSLELGL
jgi:hypothetical protein